MHDKTLVLELIDRVETVKVSPSPLGNGWVVDILY